MSHLKDKGHQRQSAHTPYERKKNVASRVKDWLDPSSWWTYLGYGEDPSGKPLTPGGQSQSTLVSTRNGRSRSENLLGADHSNVSLFQSDGTVPQFAAAKLVAGPSRRLLECTTSVVSGSQAGMEGGAGGVDREQEDSRESEESWVAEDDSDMSSRVNPACGVNVGRQLSPILREERPSTRLGNIDSRSSHSHPRGGTRLAQAGLSLPSSSAIADPVHIVEQIRNPTYKGLSKTAEGAPSPGSIFSNRTMTSSSVFSHKLFSTQPITTSTPQVSPLQEVDVTDTSTVRHHPRIMDPPHAGVPPSQEHRSLPPSDTPRPTLSRPHTGTPGPAFSIAAFTTPSRLYTDISLSRSPFQSPFYSGRTSYGGMAAGQRLRVKRPRTDTSPPNVTLTRHTVKARPAGSRDQQSVSSHTAKKILETLECLSSPLSDARKLPLRGEPYDSSTIQQPAKRRRSNHPSSSILSPPPVTPLLTPSQAHVSNIHAPIIVPNEKTGLTQNDSKAEDTKFVFVDKGNSTVIPPASSGTTSSRLPDEGPRPQGSLLLQPRGGATTSREIPLSQLPTSGLHFGALSTSSQASRLGGLTFTAPPLRQASPPVSSPQPLLLSGARGSEAEPPSVSEFSPMFHASSSQGGGKMRSHRSPRHVSRKDSSFEVNPMELPPPVPLVSNVPSFLFTAELKTAQSSPTTTAPPPSVPMATTTSSSPFSFAIPKPLGSDSSTSSAGQKSGPLPFSFSVPKNCKTTTATKLQPSSVSQPSSISQPSLTPLSLPPLRPPLPKPKLPQANPLPPLKSVSVEQILKQPEFQLRGNKADVGKKADRGKAGKAAPSEVIDLTDEEETQEVAKVPLPPLKPLPQFAAPQGSWSCDTCMINNKPSDNTCVACGAARPGSQRKKNSSNNSSLAEPRSKLPMSKADVTLSSFSLEKPLDSTKPLASEGLSLLKQFAPPAGSWSCEMCMVVNKAEDGACVACKTPRPGSKKPEQETKLTLGSSGGFKIGSSKGLGSFKLGEGVAPLKPLSQFAPPTNSWSCDTCLVTNKEDATNCIACGTAKPGAGSGTKAEGLGGGVGVQFGAQGGIKLSLGGGLSLGALASVSTSGGIKLGTSLAQKEGATIAQSEVVPIKLGSGGLKLGNLPLAAAGTLSEKKSDLPKAPESHQLLQPPSGGEIQLAPALVPTSSKESSLPSGGGITFGAPLLISAATEGGTGTAGMKLGAPLQFSAPAVSNPASELTATLASHPPSFSSSSSSSSSSSFAFKFGTTQAGASSSTTTNPLSQIKFGVPTQVTTTTTNAPTIPQFSFSSVPPTSTTTQPNLPTFNFTAGNQQQANEINSKPTFGFSATKDLGTSGDASKPSFPVPGSSGIGGTLGAFGGAQLPGGVNFGAQPGLTSSLGGGEQKTQLPQQGLALGSSETFVFGASVVSSQQQTPSQNLFTAPPPATGDQPPTKPITFNFHSAQTTTAGATQSSNPAPSLSFGSSQLAFGQSGNSGLSGFTAPQGLGGNGGGTLPKIQFGGNNPSMGGMFGAGSQDSKNSSGQSASSTGFNFSTAGMNLNFGVTPGASSAATMFSGDSNNVEGRIIRKARRRKA